MSTPPSYISIPERLKISAEQWNILKWQLLCDLRVAAPGIVQSFDPVKQTVTVQLAIRENIVQDAAVTPVAISVLQDVPIVTPRAGGFSISLPIAAGDECLVVFGDNCFDAWWQSGQVQNQMRRRRHHLSDAFAVIGIWNQTRVLSNYSANSLQIRSDDGNRIVEIAGAAVNITIQDSSPVNIVTQNGKINLQSATEIDVTAPTLKLNGNVTISGTLNLTGGEIAASTLSVSGATILSGSTTIQGKAFLTHVHTLVTTGSSDSGPVGP